MSAWPLLDSVWHVLLELAPWLLLGMAIAGVMHGLVPKSFIHQQLRGTWGIVKSVLLGVPLPLCSCGVIPAGLGLKKDGASDGAAVGFLISTPQTGVDSVLVSASFLGWPFALFKVVSAAVTGFVGGVLADLSEGRAPGGAPSDVEDVAKEDTVASSRMGAAEASASCCGSKKQAPPAPIENTTEETSPASWRVRGGEMARHAVMVLQTIWRWLAFGIVAGAAIQVYVPASAFEMVQSFGYLGGLLAVLVISMPLYVCATASVPIAASLVAGGLPTGAALVFLMAGPATNVATMGAIYRGFGARPLAAYLLTIGLGSLGFAWVFDALPLAAYAVEATAALAPATGAGAHEAGWAGHAAHSSWMAVVSAWTLLGLLAWFAWCDLRVLGRRLLAR